MKVKIIEGGRAPKRMSVLAGGFDCFARDIQFVGEQKANIALGFSIDCNTQHSTVATHQSSYNPAEIHIHKSYPMNFAALLAPRSGWGGKYGFRLRNTIGIIDSTDKTEVIAKVQWDKYPKELEIGSRVCQLMVLPCYIGDLIEVESLAN